MVKSLKNTEKAKTKSKKKLKQKSEMRKQEKWDAIESLKDYMSFKARDDHLDCSRQLNENDPRIIKIEKEKLDKGKSSYFEIMRRKSTKTPLVS